MIGGRALEELEQAGLAAAAERLRDALAGRRDLAAETWRAMAALERVEPPRALSSLSGAA